MHVSHKYTAMKLSSGQVMWEMGLKHRTWCTVTPGSVTTSLEHSRDGEWLGVLSEWRCFAKHMAAALLLRKCGCLSLCSVPAVGCFSSICSLPRRIAKKLKSKQPFFPGLWIYWVSPLKQCKRGANQWITKEHGEGNSLFSVKWRWGLLYSQSAGKSALHESIQEWYYNLLLLYSAPHFARKWILICSTGGLQESGG